MRKWFVFGLLGAAVLTGIVIWYLWRENDDFQEFVGGARGKLSSAWHHLRKA